MGLFDDASRLPRWGFPALIIVLVIFFFLGQSLPNSGVGQLEVALLQVNGFLLAFVSVAFTGMVAEVKSQNDLTIEQRKTLSRQIRIESLRSLVLLILALITSVGILTNAIANPSGQTPEYIAYALPLVFTVLGLYGILIAMYSLTKAD